MGWRDRDWAKFDEDETRSFLGTTHRVAPRRSATPRAAAATLLAAGLTGAAIVFSTHLHELGRPGRSAAVALTPAPRIVQPPADLIPIRWHASDLAPAPNAGRICVTDGRHGRICAAYVVGERPADNLTREIERRGLRVQSSG